MSEMLSMTLSPSNGTKAKEVASPQSRRDTHYRSSYAHQPSRAEEGFRAGTISKVPYHSRGPTMQSAGSYQAILSEISNVVGPRPDVYQHMRSDLTTPSVSQVSGDKYPHRLATSPPHFQRRDDTGLQKTGVTRNSGLYERGTQKEANVNSSWKNMTNHFNYATPQRF